MAAVVGVVLDRESDARSREAERDREDDAFADVDREIHEQHVRADEPAEDECGLDVNAAIAAAGTTVDLELEIHPMFEVIEEGCARGILRAGRDTLRQFFTLAISFSRFIRERSSSFASVEESSS